MYCGVSSGVHVEHACFGGKLHYYEELMLFRCYPDATILKILLKQTTCTTNDTHSHTLHCRSCDRITKIRWILSPDRSLWSPCYEPCNIRTTCNIQHAPRIRPSESGGCPFNSTHLPQVRAIKWLADWCPSMSCRSRWLLNLRLSSCLFVRAQRVHRHRHSSWPRPIVVVRNCVVVGVVIDGVYGACAGVDACACVGSGSVGWCRRRLGLGLGLGHGRGGRGKIPAAGLVLLTGGAQVGHQHGAK